MKRREAKTIGDKKYFTGKPCKHGHNSFRYTKSAACVSCTSWFHYRRNFKKTEKPIYVRVQVYRKDTAAIKETAAALCLAHEFDIGGR